tara:strand:- start:2362 stop:2883 length:522 start_codon:yes stop_codon:yes gene_type:complete
MKSLIALMLVTIIVNAATFPEIKGQTLADKKINLPQKTQYHLFILGFDMNSSNAMSRWVNQLNLSPSSNMNWIQIPVIGSVPPFVDGFIKGGMKNTVSENMRANYFPYFGNKKEAILMSIHGSKELDDAVTPYIVIVSPTANVTFSKQMLATTRNVKELLAIIEKYTINNSVK